MTLVSIRTIPPFLLQLCLKVELQLGRWIGVLFFIMGILSINHYGLTWDEFETIDGGRRAFDLVSSFFTGAEPEPLAHQLPGYYFVFDLLRHLFFMCLSGIGLSSDPVFAFHFFHLIISSLSLVVLFDLVVYIWKDSRLAFWVTISLALFPQFIAHSQNNPKDLVALFAILLSIRTLICLFKNSKWINLFWGAFSLGLAGSTSTLSVILVPLAATYAAVFRRNRFKEWPKLFGFAVLSALAFYFFWPWIWDEPIAKLAWVAKKMNHIHLRGPQNLFLGNFHTTSETPRTYFLVNFLANTPVLLLVLALVGLVIPCRNQPLRELKKVGALWVGFFVVFEALASHRYDSTRHLLAILPGFCILVGMGAHWIAQRQKAWLVLGYAYLFCVNCYMHPYEGAYLNEVANYLFPTETEKSFEIEYFGHSYKEGSEWITKNAEPTARIFVPLAPKVARYYLGERVVLDKDQFHEFFDGSKVSYFMVMMRAGSLKAFYGDFFDELAQKAKLVYSVRRQNGVLLKIFENSFSSDVGEMKISKREANCEEKGS